MSFARTLRRQEARQQARNKIPTIRTHPKEVIKALNQGRKKAMKLQNLINRLWYYDDWDMFLDGWGEG